MAAISPGRAFEESVKIKMQNERSRPEGTPQF
jgi:hypothetical protein